MTYQVLHTEGPNAAGKYYLTIHIEDGGIDYRTPTLKFHSEPSTEDIEAVVNQFLEANRYMYEPRVENFSEEDKEMLSIIIHRIKTNPSITLAQYNNYLATLPFQHAAHIRLLIYRAAMFVADKKGVVLNNVSETELLQKVRNWIVATEWKQICYMFFDGRHSNLL